MSADEFVKLNKNQMEELMNKVEESGKLDPAVMVQVKELRKLYHLAGEQAMAVKTGGIAAKPTGGDEDDKKTDLDKRVAKQRAERQILLEEFIRKTTASYQQIVSGIMDLAPELGKRIPLTDKLTDFKDAIVRLIDLNRENINVDLIGFALDAVARANRETFISSVRHLIGATENVLSMDVYKSHQELFIKIKNAAEELLKTVDSYSDVVKKKYGGEEIASIGGASMGYLSSEDMPKLKQSILNIRAAVKKFQYFFYIAKFKENVARTSSELDAYGENYVNVLADAIGGRRMKLQNEKKARLDDIDAKAPAELKEKLKEYIKKEYEVKDRFYKTVEAVDLHLKAFTKDITANIDDVKDIKRLLDGIEFIADFYREAAGNNLASAFDCFGYDNVTGRRVDDAQITESNVSIPANTHYYQKVGSGNTVGVPYIGVSVNRIDLVRKFLNKFFDNFTALKNIIDAFVKIGDKLGSSAAKIGGLDLKQTTFMSPTEIYKNLTEYLKVSSTNLGREFKPPAVLTTQVRVGDKNVNISYDGSDVKYNLFMSMIDGFDLDLNNMDHNMISRPATFNINKQAAETKKLHDAAAELVAERIDKITDIANSYSRMRMIHNSPAGLLDDISILMDQSKQMSNAPMYLTTEQKTDAKQLYADIQNLSDAMKQNMNNIDRNFGVPHGLVSIDSAEGRQYKNIYDGIVVHFRKNMDLVDTLKGEMQSLYQAWQRARNMQAQQMDMQMGMQMNGQGLAPQLAPPE